MTVTDWMSILASTIIGLASGLVYFGGLWVTVRRLPVLGRPMLVALGGMACRLGLALVCVYWIGAGHWSRIASWLLGFFAMRAVLVRRWQPRRLTTGGS